MPQICRLLNAEDGRVIIDHLELATSFWQRFAGLQFRAPLKSNSGLLLAPCNSVHTMCCRFAMDITMLDPSGVVIARHENVVPWRVVSANRKAKFIIETLAGAITLQKGSKVHLDLSPSESPKALKPLIALTEP